MSDRHRQDVQPVDVGTAAQALGISRDAVRSRIRRGKLEAVKDSDSGEWRIYLPEGVRPTGEATAQDVTAELIRELRQRLEDKDAEIDRLERTLEREQQLHAALLARIPQLPAPEGHESASKTSADPARDAQDRRSWIDRVLGR